MSALKPTGTYPLPAIKAAFSDPYDLEATDLAFTGAMGLGMNAGAIVNLVQGLTGRDFHRSVAAENNPDQMMDEYKPHTSDGVVYIKFSAHADGILYIVDLKRN